MSVEKRRCAPLRYTHIYAFITAIFIFTCRYAHIQVRRYVYICTIEHTSKRTHAHIYVYSSEQNENPKSDVVQIVAPQKNRARFFRARFVRFFFHTVFTSPHQKFDGCSSRASVPPGLSVLLGSKCFLRVLSTSSDAVPIEPSRYGANSLPMP